MKKKKHFTLIPITLGWLTDSKTVRIILLTFLSPKYGQKERTDFSYLVAYTSNKKRQLWSKETQIIDTQ